MALPRKVSGKAGLQAAVRAALETSPVFKGPSTFYKAWDRLANDGRIALEA